MAEKNKTMIFLKYIGLIALISALLFYLPNFLLMQYCMATTSLKDGEPLKTSRLYLEMYYPFSPRNFIARLDDRDISRNIWYGKDRLIIDVPGLSGGSHTLEFGAKGFLNPVTLISLDKKLRFYIYNRKPVIYLDSPRDELIRKRELIVRGRTEPKIRCNILVNGISHIQESDEKGNFIKTVNIDREKNTLQVYAMDPAGNKAKIFKKFILDEFPPRIDLLTNLESGILDVNYVDLEAEITDTGSGIRDCYFLMDGKKIPGSFDKITGKLNASFDNLDQGTYRIQVVAEDKAHWKSTAEWIFTVDSTEYFGGSNLKLGARGQDVEALQNRLVRLGYLDKNAVNGKFDATTKTAVETAQKSRNLPVTGRMDRDTMLAITDKIYVYLDEFHLYLLSPDNKILKDYIIACGSYDYPTPTGEYYVTEKVYHPTWLPPKSTWAKDAKPAPPGPENPLGTRWIGLNRQDVGIHGTPSSWSIGSASSHGCIRMHIWEVEELFELVNVGTPVTIYPSRPAEHRKLPSINSAPTREKTSDKNESAG